MRQRISTRKVAEDAGSWQERSSQLRPAARIAASLALVFAIAPARAEVVRLVSTDRRPFADGQAFGRSGPYERRSGRLEFLVDPESAANAAVVDLKRAPRDAQGRVAFAADFVLLMPADPARGNRRLIYDVNNRGNKLILGAFNDHGGNDPIRPADAGNGFLMRQGYSILWCGWNGDVAPGNGKLLIDLPVATENGLPITGPVHAEICVDARSFSQPFYWGGSDPYPAVDLNTATARVTKRLTRHDPVVEIPRDRWAFARFEHNKPVPDPKSLYLADGFQPGWLYELVYVAKNPRVTGLGLAAVRDAVSFFRYAKTDRYGTANPFAIDANRTAPAGAAVPAGPASPTWAKRSAGSEPPAASLVERAYGFGISQSGRFLHHLVYEGFNTDERGRIVFDGVLAHVGGGGRGLFNARFAQTTRHGSPHEDNLYPSDVFPFTSTPSRDPVAGKTGDMLERARRMGHVPKMFFTETSTEYWCRAASLLHTTVDGSADVPLDPNVRIYFIAGGQHGVASAPARGRNQNPQNILDYRPALRALLVALDRWAASGVEPPASAYPRIGDGSLVTVAAFRKSFPRVAGVNLPRAAYTPLRLDLGPRWDTLRIADVVPPRIGPPYCTLVPAVGPDGNEIAGVHLIDVAVPVATFTGWNLRGNEAGAPGELTRLTGSYLPFARTRSERERTDDPRPSVLERYATRDAYVQRVRQAVAALRESGFLLDEDATAILDRASRRTEWSVPSR